MKTIRVTATQFDHQWAVECSACNFVALTASALVDRISAEHLHTHKDQT